jgi:hypothetical protein
MEARDIPSPDTRDSLSRALNRLELCTFAIQEIHEELDEPQTPDSKADLLLAVEALVFDALHLLQTTKKFVWGDDPDSNI